MTRYIVYMAPAKGGYNVEVVDAESVQDAIAEYISDMALPPGDHPIEVMELSKFRTYTVNTEPKIKAKYKERSNVS